MVHKKYIKRGGRVFGPYLYENYREKGVTKTRYLGLADSKKQKNKKRIDKSLVMVSIFLILIIVLGFTSLFLYETGFFGVGEGREGLGSYSPLDLFKKLFIASSPLNVFVQIRGNTAPEILGLPYGIELCENTELGGEIYKFYVEDKDGDFVFVTLDNPVPFYVEKFGDKPNVNITNVTVLSQPLFKKFVISNRNGNDAWAIWTLTINAKDILSAIAIPKSFDITIIEVNNAPEFDMDVATIELGDNIYTVGDEHVWTYDLGAYLHTPPRYEETLTADLIFNLTYVNGSLSPFSIDENGLINITGNESFIPEGEESWNFYLNVSVKDSGLSMRDEIHENISDCYGADPRGDEDYKSWSDDFWLTITKQNRAPVITSHYPPELNLSVVGEEALEFNLTARDPDYTPLDVQWYVDDVLRETDSDIREYNLSKFEYSFPCGVSGSHNISGVANDGLLNDSIVWNISVELVGCPGPASPGSPSGGSSSRVYCEEKWGCGQWTQCHNLNELFEFGWTRKETELLIKERCGIFGLGEEVCGFQQRICTDFNYCNTENEKPADIRECHYTENPTCEDGIKNCHSEGCEVLIDCGGPCEACPTCEDGIKNQKEERIDCGGPCEICVEQPLGPIILRYVVVYSLLLLLILILVLVGRQAIKYVRGKKIFTTSNTKNLIIRKGNKGLEKRNILKSLFFIGFIVVLLFFANNYMAGISQTNTIISGFSDVGEGLLSSYGFLNNLLGNLGLFFISVPVAISGNTRLQIFDDTEDYLIEWTERSGHDVYFYANYTENGDTGTYDPLSGGICNIRIQDSDKVYGLRDLMIYNSSPNSLLFEYSQTIDYKGKYLFDVNCSLGVLEVQAFDNFTIENTAPSINTDDGGIYIDFDDIKGDTDHLPCIEDVLCSYNFKTNITDPDTNDVWTYFVEESNTTLTDYDLDENGILNISITHSSNTGIGLAAKKIQLGVKDNELDALIYEAKLWVDVQEVNDKPIFRDLDNQTLIAEDRFIYDIHIDDEESNNPFVFNISVIKCAPLLRNNCTLLREVFEYTQDKDSGVLKIDFTPTLNDIGDYKINFSVMDYNETLGNSTASQVVNFTVNWPIWNESLITTYVLYEEVPFYLNLSKNVVKLLERLFFLMELLSLLLI